MALVVNKLSISNFVKNLIIMDVILRVKRNRDEKPVDLISFEKKPKRIENMMENLSLAPNLVWKRVQRQENMIKVDSESILDDLKSKLQDSSFNRLKNHRASIMKKWRNKVLEKENIVYCNGEPLVSCAVYNGKLENCVIDEYVLCENFNDERPSGVVNWICSDSENEFSSDKDSEDSNREDHPWHDYPDESDSEDYSSKSEDYEDYEVE